MTAFVSVARAGDETHYLVTDPSVPLDAALEVVRRRTFVSNGSAGRRVASWAGVTLGVAVAWWLAWDVAGLREPPSFVVPVAAGASAGAATSAGLRALARWIGGLGTRGRVRAGHRSRAETPGVLEYVPVEVRQWADAGHAPVADVVDLARACVATRSALTSIELWREATSDGSWPHADAVVGPVLAAEYEARRAELDELAARLGFTVPTDFPSSLED
ncbi:hypothetical protein IFT36_10545 [Frigoribacterium sp. CFBP 13605]|uniref:hypothetical protein n=1 Tax=Frigoribacterium sp. CFBP 13605 TaxID=2774034 RepID=UPI00190545BE|nr:hypothetical protein [Frigoribacterium sp. CFBP 13605]MBD8140979.1 hypothetical protein [Frigoribacterium sp. CFBP 13605]